MCRRETFGACDPWYHRRMFEAGRIRLLVLLLLPASGCECGEGSPLSRVEPKLEVAPEVLAFGDVAIGATKRLSLTLRNPGTGDLTIDSVDAMSPFATALPGPVIAAGAEVTIEVAFSPSNDEAASGSLAILSNDPANPTVTVPLSGRGVPGVVT